MKKLLLVALMAMTGCTPVFMDDGTWFIRRKPVDGSGLYLGGCLADRPCDETPGDNEDNRPTILRCITVEECRIVFDLVG